MQKIEIKKSNCQIMMVLRLTSKRPSFCGHCGTIIKVGQILVKHILLASFVDEGPVTFGYIHCLTDFHVYIFTMKNNSQSVSSDIGGYGSDF